MKKMEKATGGLKKRIRDRMRSVNKKVMAIALAGRLRGPEGEERRVERYRELLSLTRKILHQAEGVLEETHHGKMENALVKGIIEHADGTKLQVDVVGLDLTTLIDTKQLVE